MKFQQGNRVPGISGEGFDFNSNGLIDAREVGSPQGDGINNSFLTPDHNLNSILFTESTLNPESVSKTGAVGLGQQTASAIKDFNDFSKTGIKFTKEDMKDPQNSAFVAAWQFNKRIPQQLDSLGLEDNLSNKAMAYNGGSTKLRNLYKKHKIDSSQPGKLSDILKKSKNAKEREIGEYVDKFWRHRTQLDQARSDNQPQTLMLKNQIGGFAGGGLFNIIGNLLNGGQLVEGAFDRLGNLDSGFQNNREQAQEFLLNNVPDGSKSQLSLFGNLAALTQGQLFGQNVGNITPNLANYQTRGSFGFREGGIPINPQGLREENGPVIIPSNQISMKGINTPVFALGDGGEMTLMMPDQEFVFPESQNVLEIPVMDKGGKVVRIEEVDKAFFGKLVKGIGKGIGAVAKGFKDVALFGVDNFTNLAFGADLIKDGAFSYGISKDLSNFTGNALNKVGDFAVPLAATAFLGPAGAAAVSGIRGTTNSLADGNSLLQSLGSGALGAGAAFAGSSALGNTGGFNNIGGNAARLFGDSAGQTGIKGLINKGKQLGQVQQNLSRQNSQFGGIANLLGLGQQSQGLGNLGNFLGPIQLGGLGQLPNFGTPSTQGVAGGTFDLRQFGGIDLSPFVGGALSGLAAGAFFRHGGPVHGYGEGRKKTKGKLGRRAVFGEGGVEDMAYRGAFVPNPNPTPIQTETIKGRAEQIIWPTLHITEVNADRSHDQLKKSGEEDIATDFVTEGAYITSAYGGITLKRDDLDEFEIDVISTQYSEHAKGKVPKISTAADMLLKKGEDSIVPSEAAKRLQSKFKIRDRNDIFSDFTDSLNLAHRRPYIEAIVSLSEYEKGKKERAKERKKLRKALKNQVSSQVARDLALELVQDEEKPTSTLFRYGGKVKAKKGVKLENVEKAQQGAIPYGIPAGIPTLPTLPIPQLPTPQIGDVLGGLSGRVSQGFDFGSALSGLVNSPQGADLISRILGGGQQTQQLPQIQLPNQTLGNVGLGLAGGANIAGSALNFAAAGRLNNQIGNEIGNVDRLRDLNQGSILSNSLFGAIPFLTNRQAPQRSQVARRQFVNPSAAQASSLAQLNQMRGQTFSALRNAGMNPQLANVRGLEAGFNVTANLAGQRVAQQNTIFGQRALEDNQDLSNTFLNQTDQFNLDRQNTTGLAGALGQGISNSFQNEIGRQTDFDRLRREQILSPLGLNLAGVQGLNNLAGLLQAAQSQRNTLSLQQQTLPYQLAQLG